jgi:putative transposase
MILHMRIAMVAGWIQRHQQQVITSLLAGNRVLTAQLGGRRLRLTDTERRRLAAFAHPLGRQRLKAIATIATPDTLMRWYKRLIAQKFDGSRHRQKLGRPRVAEEIAQLHSPRPQRETEGPGGRIVPAPRHADGPRPSAR